MMVISLLGIACTSKVVECWQHHWLEVVYSSDDYLRLQKVATA